MSIKYEFSLVDIELEGIFYTVPPVGPSNEPTQLVAFTIQQGSDNLYLTFDGREPNMSIDRDGNLIVEEFDGMPTMYIDEDGDMIIED